MARKFQIWAILLMVCAMGFTVAAQSTSQGASSPKTVTGIVLSAEDGEPVIGAHICAKGTKNGTASDFDGKFSICVTDGTVLTVSCPGLKPQEIVADASQPMKVVLETDENAPDYLTSSFNVIGIIRMDSLDYVLPESEFLIAQQHIDILKGDYYKLKNIEICRAKYLLNREIDKRKNNVSIYGTPALDLSSYARQYLGFKHNGHRLVFISLTEKTSGQTVLTILTNI